MLISSHFTVAEFSCHGSGKPYPSEWVDDRLQALCGVLDAVRDAWGGPLTVVSGYRDPAYNQALFDQSAARNHGVSGVARNSQHIQGRAADVRPANPTVDRVRELHGLVLTLCSQGRTMESLGGLGLYPNWVHLDVRAHAPGVLAQWTGAGFGSEPTA
jgi:uncharacterized protein YcbK (DUF882 family)